MLRASSSSEKEDEQRPLLLSHHHQGSSSSSEGEASAFAAPHSFYASTTSAASSSSSSSPNGGHNHNGRYPKYSLPAGTTAAVAPKSYQFKALMRKNLKLQIRQRCTMACQILVPLILLLFVGSMQILFNVLSKNEDRGWVYEDPVRPLNFSSEEVEYPFFFGADPNNLTSLGYLRPDGSKAGFLGGIAQKKVNDTLYLPIMQTYPTRAKLMSMLVYVKDEWYSAVTSGKAKEVIPFPALAFTFNNLSYGNATEQPAQFNMEILAETQFPYLINYKNMDTSEYITGGLALMLKLFVEAVATAQEVIVNIHQQEFPYKEDPLKVDLGSFLAALMYPLVLSWLLPVFIYNIVLEKQEKLREMMKMMGMKMSNYWWTTYFYNVVLYLMVVIITYIVSYAFRFAVFTQGSPIALLFSFLLWGHCLIGISFAMSAIFNKTRVATIFSYFLVILQVIISFIVNVIVWQDKGSPFIWNLWPPFAFYRIIYILGIHCGLGECPQTGDYDWGNEITHLWVFMVITGNFFFFLAWYLDNVLPKEFGIARKPWFFLQPVYRYFVRLFAKLRNKEVVDDAEGTVRTLTLTDKEDGGEVSMLVKSVKIDEGDLEDLAEPDDVAHERQRVYSGAISPDSPVIIVDLHKEYSTGFRKAKKVAVRNVTFAIDQGECFGLLGPNGAGKTTTISILTGLFPPTSGSARVGGFDISTDIDSAHRVMGVCPQFDTLWMDLTCEETLLFYARLKGIGRKEEDAHVANSLDQVGLLPFKKRLVKNLSGGMRRRLSVAVSIVGDPRIIFLDEPTTGLDPESRRQLWDVLNHVKQGRCIILTTHSMEEADVLCTKIGIMANGMLRCVGPQQELKVRYGQGYTLKLNYELDCQQRVSDFIEELLPTATLLETFAGTSTYQIPKKDLVIHQVFDAIEARKAEAGITDWGINQTSLEDVFLHIVREAEGETSS